MDVLIRFGFSIEEIKSMMDANDEINDIEDKNINELIDVLNKVGCSSKIIKNIFISNPFCLSRNVDEVKRLIVKLFDIGLSHLEILFDNNPYLLNVNYKEVDELYKNKVKEGLSNEEIANYFYNNSWVMI